MKKYRLLVIIIILLILGFFLDPTGALKPAKNVLFQITKPMAMLGNFSLNKISLFFSNLFQLRTITLENRKLIQENLELQSKLSVLTEAQHENEILKKELGFFENQRNLNLIPANVIGRPISGYLKTIIIDRGIEDNLKTGQGVISQGFLVGTVKDVWSKTAEVTLISNYNSLVPVILQESRGTGLLRGGLEGLTIEDIPLNIDIKTGEQVSTSGLGGDIPSGILVGKVSGIVSKKGEIFQKATVTSPINIYYLEFVFVVGND